MQRVKEKTKIYFYKQNIFVIPYFLFKKSKNDNVV